MNRTKLKITPSESVTVVSSGPDLLELEAEYAPAGKSPPKHFHPSQTEDFEVLSGSLVTRVDGSERTLQAGDTLGIPSGAVHQMWNPGAMPTRVVWKIQPQGRTREWFEAIDRLHREGRVGRNGMPGPLAFGVLLNEYDDVFRLAGPTIVIRPLVKLLALLGRGRGYLPAN